MMFLSLQISRYRSTSNYMNLIFFSLVTQSLFQSLATYFNLYRLLRILRTMFRGTLTPRGRTMQMSSLRVLSMKALFILTQYNLRSFSHITTINTLKVLCLIVGVKVSLKSTLNFYKKPLITSLTLNFLIALLIILFILKTYFKLTRFTPLRGTSSLQVLLLPRAISSFQIASFYIQPYSRSSIATLQDFRRGTSYLQAISYLKVVNVYSSTLSKILLIQLRVRLTLDINIINALYYRAI